MKGCKKCPAFAKCTVTYRSSGCEALRWTYGIDTDPGIITNADRIRAMSDKELDIFLKDVKNRARIIAIGNKPELLKNLVSLEWLQRPARDR